MRLLFPRPAKAFAILLVSFLMSSCSGFKDLECTGIDGFRINSLNLSGIDAVILLKIKNPNRYGFSIFPSAFDVKYSGIYLGKAKLTKRVRIKAGAEKTYSFGLKSDFSEINPAELLKLISETNRRNIIEVKGDLKAGKFLILKKIPVDIKQRPAMN